MDELPEIPVSATRRFKPFTDEDIVQRIRQFNSGDYGTRKKALSSVVRMGRPAIPALLTALTEDEWHTRVNALEALRLIGDLSRIAAPLIAALEYPRGGAEVHSCLLRMGDTITVAKHLLCDESVSVAERKRLYNVWRTWFSTDEGPTLPELAVFCRRIAKRRDSSAELAAAAQAMLEHETLLRGSEPNLADAGEMLLRPAQGSTADVHSGELLRAVSLPDGAASANPLLYSEANAANAALPHETDVSGQPLGLWTRGMNWFRRVVLRSTTQKGKPDDA